MKKSDKQKREQVIEPTWRVQSTVTPSHSE
jgi:hypothetical protein